MIGITRRDKNALQITCVVLVTEELIFMNPGIAHINGSNAKIPAVEDAPHPYKRSKHSSIFQTPSVGNAH